MQQTLDANDRVLVVDDWVETGNQALAARELILRSGSALAGFEA